ncbi:MAG: aminotransferase class I/II-fold pyridoxal phosphate-dependent enzyme [Candidatus Hodarchaeales archaeon]
MKHIRELVDHHIRFRKESINLIASENLISPVACKILHEAHLTGRYHASFYGGVSYIKKLMVKTVELVQELFRVKHAIVSPLSGNLSVLASLLAFSDHGDEVAILDLKGGGYPLNMEYFGRKKLILPHDEKKQNIDTERAISILDNHHPPLVFLGASLFPFPHPVKELSNVVHEYGGKIVYDGSHVLGLIAGREFQDPLGEGADVLIGSTHKSFPGPQGGVILASDDKIIVKLQEACTLEPVNGIVLLDNPHPARIAALGAVTEELLDNGRAEKYARTVVENAKALAGSLNRAGFSLKGKESGFTASHQVLSRIKDFEEGAKMRDILQEHEIITDAALRFGTAEVTRLGYDKRNMDEIGTIIAQILSDDYKVQSDKPILKKKVKDLVDKHGEIVL